MPHYYNLVFTLYKFTKCMGFNPCLNPCVLLYLNTLAPVIGNLVPILYNRLISTSSQSEIYGCTGIFIACYIAVSIYTKSYTYSNSHLISYVYISDLFQYGKFGAL